MADEFAGGVCVFGWEGGVDAGEVCGVCGVEEERVYSGEGAGVGWRLWGWGWCAGNRSASAGGFGDVELAL